MTVADNIKRLRLANDLTQEQLAEKIGVTRSTVTQWETGWSQPRMGAVAKLADAFNVSLADIVENEPTPRTDPNFIEIPLYGRIAAGEPLEMEESDESTFIPTAIHDKYPNAFCLKVEGNSMNRILPDGCHAVINPCTEVIHDNHPYAICVNGYDATIKRVRKLNNGFELVPDSTDPTYTTKTYNYNDEACDPVTPIGEVVYHVLPFDWEY